MKNQHELEYLNAILNPIRICSDYRPMFGHKKKNGYTLSEFQELYGKDIFYHWLGLDNPLLYAAHKAAGGMTSIYRQIGIGCESVFHLILRHSLALSESDVQWSYNVSGSKNKTRILHLDGRIPIDKIIDHTIKERLCSWLKGATDELSIDPSIANSLKGIVFEVRQGYKSKDSKRQNADIANASMAYSQAYLPCVFVLSTQIDDDILYRYRSENWLVLVGNYNNPLPLESSYSFMKYVIGYDLANFFERNSPQIRNEIDKVLHKLLEAQ